MKALTRLYEKKKTPLKVESYVCVNSMEIFVRGSYENIAEHSQRIPGNKRYELRQKHEKFYPDFFPDFDWSRSGFSFKPDQKLVFNKQPNWICIFIKIQTNSRECLLRINYFAVSAFYSQFSDSSLGFNEIYQSTDINQSGRASSWL